MKILLVIVLALSLCYCDNWAVLVAGSNGYYNYRHQSDVCHSYQILVNHGIDPENIIVMAFDDIANNIQNPFPGTMFNKPTGTKAGVNVYEGCKIDYTGHSVNPSNYLAILTGNASGVVGGNGRVLKSGRKDNVFLYFADHGAPGLIAFPTQYLYANQLQDALTTMHKDKMYKQLTYYLEACESGSMFLGMPDNTNIYAVSAASPNESSWATYCPPNDEVNGKHIGSCLGDEFSVNWMENSESSDTATLTLQQQYVAVRAATKQSQVMQWGDLSFTSEPVGDFQGMKNDVALRFMIKVQNHFRALQDGSTTSYTGDDSRFAKIKFLMNKFNQNPTEYAVYEELKKEIEESRKFASIFESFKTHHKLDGVYKGTTNFDCYKTLIDNLEGKCGKLNEQSLRHLKYLYQYCAMEANWQNAEFWC